MIKDKQLTIEFILPRHLLCHEVEHWTDEWGAPLGIRYRVVVRSRERLRNKKLQRFWCCCWNEAKQRAALQQPTQATVAQVNQSQLQIDDDKLCFILTFVPHLAANLKKDFLFSLIRFGVPIALWPRYISNANEAKQLNKLLSCTLEQLPQRVFKIRQKHRSTRRRTEKRNNHVRRQSKMVDLPRYKKH